MTDPRLIAWTQRLAEEQYTANLLAFLGCLSDEAEGERSALISEISDRLGVDEIIDRRLAGD